MGNSEAAARIYVHSRRELGITAHRLDFAKGTRTDPAPYGFDEAEAAGLTLDYSEARPATLFTRFMFEKLNFDILHAVDNLSRIRKADAVWTLLEWEWMSIALLQKLRLTPRTPIIANSVWLAHWWDAAHPVKRRLFRWLMGRNVFLTTHSRRAADLLSERMPGKRFAVSPFGVSNKAWRLTPPARIEAAHRLLRIYSIGTDQTRDWGTLLEAFGNNDRFHLTIVCGWLDRSLAARYRNVVIKSGALIDEQHENYRAADIVAVAMKPNNYAGITVALEAACLGKPCICSDTGGVDTYFDKSEVLYVPPSDSVALRNAVLGTNPDAFYEMACRAQYRFIMDRYDARGMVDRYRHITEHAFGIRMTNHLKDAPRALKAVAGR